MPKSELALACKIDRLMCGSLQEQYVALRGLSSFTIDLAYAFCDKMTAIFDGEWCNDEPCQTIIDKYLNKEVI